jgi:lambda family phage portal protein
MFGFKKKTKKQVNRGILYKKMRNYDAAKVDNLTASWTTAPQTIDDIIRQNLNNLRTRSRNEQYNNDYARRFINLVKSNIVGPKGLVLQVRSKNQNGKLDVTANDAIEKTWKDWGKAWNCSIDGRLSFTELQRLIVSTIAGDGEALIRKHRRGKYGFQLEIIDASWLDETYNDELNNGNIVRLGIEYNGTSTPVAYYLADPKTRANMFTGYNNSKNYVRVPANQIYHIYLTDFVAQKRGIPWMSTSMLRMHHLKGYENAALVNARTGASKMGFFTSATGSEYTGEGTNELGETISTAEPGTFEQLPEGVAFTKYDPEYPNGEFSAFTKATLRGIASGLGISYNKLANDLESVNFSSMRSGELDERETWKLLQEWFIDSFLERLYIDWLEVVIFKPGIFTTNGRLSVEKIDKYKTVTFQGKRWPWVDPMKDVQAAILAVDNGLRSRSDVIRETTGREPEDVWKEMQHENEVIEELGIELINNGETIEADDNEDQSENTV